MKPPAGTGPGKHLGAELNKHNIGGLSFGGELSTDDWRVVVGLLAAFIATQNTPVEDWHEWVKAIGIGAGYKVAPEFLQYLLLLRAKYGNPQPEPMIGRREVIE